jgi:hypothetical protein
MNPHESIFFFRRIFIGDHFFFGGREILGQQGGIDLDSREARDPRLGDVSINHEFW